MKVLIPDLIVQKYQKGETNGKFSGTAIFLDISGFTPMTEKLMRQGKVGVEVLSKILNNMFEKVIHIIYQEEGFISTFAGDALTSIFSTVNGEKPLKVALKILEFFKTHGSNKTQFGEFNLEVKLGLSFGEIRWGIVGSDEYKSFYFRGEAINGCAASEHLCSKGEIVIDTKLKSILPNQKYSFEFKEENYFSVSFQEVSNLSGNQTRLGEIRSSDTPESLMRLFFPSLLQQEISSEFRDITSVFISFEEPGSFSGLNKIVSRVLEHLNSFGGYLSSLDFGDKGSLLLVLFGAPTSYEDNNLRAADFANHVRNELGDKIKIGITFGTTFTGFVGSELRNTYTALGNIVNLSGRFMASASPGQVLISNHVAKYIEREFQVKYSEKKTFKGIEGEVEVYELLQSTYFEDEGLHTGGFVGREDESERLKKFSQKFLTGSFAGMIYVYGEAGVGKSKFLYEFTKPLIKSGAALIVLQTDSILRKSLNPFIAHFMEYFNISQKLSEKQKKAQFKNIFDELIAQVKSRSFPDPKEVNSLMENLLSNWASMAAMINIQYKDFTYENLDAKSRFAASLSVIRSYFLLRSLIQPLILVIEDAYHIDEDSKQAIDNLCSGIPKIPLIIFASCRLGDDGSKPKFLSRNKNFEKEISLKPLKRSESNKLIRFLLDKPIHENLSNFIIEHSEGNPLYIEEFCKYLLRNNMMHEIKGVYELASKNVDIPEGIGSVLVARIDRLPKDIKKVILMASVLGREFNVHVLPKLISGEAIDFNEALQEGIRQNIWKKFSGNFYQFNQSTLREVAYSMQLTEDLKKLHKKSAEALVAYYGDHPGRMADIAHHYEKAGILDKTVEYLYKAVTVAGENYHNENCLDLYKKLLTYLEDNEEKIKIYAKIAEIKELTGLWEQAIASLSEGIGLAQKIENELISADLQSYIGEILQKKGEPKKAIYSILEAISVAERYEDDRILSRCYLNLGRTYWGQGNFKKSMESLETAFQLKSKIKDDSGTALALYYTGVVKRDQGDIKKAVEYYKKSEKLFTKVRDRRYLTYPLYDLGVIYQYQGDLDTSEKHFKKCAFVYKEIGYKSGESAALLNIGVAHFLRGNYDQALDLFNQSLRLANQLGERMAIAFALFRLSTVYYEMELYRQSIAYAKQALIEMTKSNAQGYFGYIFSYLSCIYAKMGNPDHSIKAAYYGMKNIKKIGSDVENGRIYMGLGIALSINKKISRISLQRLKAIQKMCGAIENTPKQYFELSIDISRKVKYIPTLIHALCIYAEYLIQIGEESQAKSFIEDALKIAKNSKMNPIFKTIKDISKDK